MVPHDPEPPTVTSGIRIGTPALTTRGMDEEDLHEIGEMIGMVIRHPESENIREEVSSEVENLLEDYPLYSDSEVEY